MHPKHELMLQHARMLVPPMNFTQKKGNSGRICVIGGSEMYTGAPYFSGMCALRTGADLCHVVCSRSAATAIKSYSPELIVHPLMYTQSSICKVSSKENCKKEALREIENLLSRVDVVVIGPGLSRDQEMSDVALSTIEIAESKRLPVVIDGDALSALAGSQEFRGKLSQRVFLTPNSRELRRLMNCELLETSDPQLDKKMDEATVLSSFGQQTTIIKGETDLIVCSDHRIPVQIVGCPRRCGGLGDLVSGALATFLCWRVKILPPGKDFRSSLIESEITTSACYAALLLVKVACNETFKIHGRSMVAGDVLGNLGNAFEKLFTSN